MPRTEHTWQTSVRLAPHYLAIGDTTLFLYGQTLDDFPWAYVTDCQPGGNYRIDMTIDIRFAAPHPCGLTFEWTIDLEPREAQGHGDYRLDTARIARVLALLPLSARVAMHRLLQQCAEHVAARGAEYQALAERQRADAALLWDMCRLTGKDS